MEEDKNLDTNLTQEGKELGYRGPERLDLSNIDEKEIIEEVLNEEPLTAEVKQQLVQIIESNFEKITTTSGPLPSASEMLGYSQADPSIINFIIESAKLEQEHRHKMHQQEFDITAKDRNDTLKLLKLESPPKRAHFAQSLINNSCLDNYMVKLSFLSSLVS